MRRVRCLLTSQLVPQPCLTTVLPPRIAKPGEAPTPGNKLRRHFGLLQTSMQADGFIDAFMQSLFPRTEDCSHETANEFALNPASRHLPDDARRTDDALIDDVSSHTTCEQTAHNPVVLPDDPRDDASTSQSKAAELCTTPVLSDAEYLFHKLFVATSQIGQDEVSPYALKAPGFHIRGCH